MARPILHIYGPFAIQWYGVTIAAGLVAFALLLHRDQRFKKLGIEEQFASLLLVGVVAGLLGGRALYLLGDADGITSLFDLINFWHGGFSVLGTILGVLAVVPAYVYYLGIPIVALMDVVAIYAPLLQSISRIGCFIAGCCYGKVTGAWWGVTYTDQSAAAPLFVRLHPTQLYSAGLLFAVFLMMYFWVQNRCRQSGQLVCAYLMLSSTERFVVDIWRADQTVQYTVWLLSLQQLIALGIFAASAMIYIGITLRSRQRYRIS